MRKKILIFLLFLMGLGWSEEASAGFGISPPYLKNNFLIPGSSYEQTINLLRSSAEDELTANIEVDAPEIASWIKIDKGNSFILPKNEVRVPMTVRVDVPKNAEVGTYEGRMNVRVASAGTGGPGVSVALGARIDISLTVTNESLTDFLIRQVLILDETEELEWPWNVWPLKYFFFRIKARLTLENKGNVKIAPSKVRLDIYDPNMNLLESSNDKSLKKVEPFATEDIIASFPTNLTAGTYSGKISVFKGEQIVGTFKMGFDIHKAGELGGRALGPWPKILAAAVFVLIILLVFLFVKYRGWRIFIFLALVIWAVLRTVFGPLAKLLAYIYQQLKKKIFEWALEKAREYEKHKKDQ